MKKGTVKGLINSVGDVFTTFLVTALIAAVLGNWLIAAGSLAVGVLGIIILHGTGKMPLQNPVVRKNMLVVTGVICFLFLPAAFIAVLAWHWIIAAKCIAIGAVGLGILYAHPIEILPIKSGHKQA
ncbi:hypothetical protein B1757_13495 [Acidithiobacillus marinus]|uniref:Uncharacterized protein n=1 Tax=Acidithiobacillus marinus TaxID=187490 RepID=A0A2I1DIN9_9PROT|nr:hypothetical protein [Acidithiobacillus marinus]PKY09737.1 hypothetical protein B1757_13495 [Acidithiobacillus marinus]